MLSDPKTLLKSIAAGAALGMGIVAAVVQLLDWVLTPKQKQWTNDRIAGIWVWLQGQTSGKFFAGLWSLPVQMLFVLAALILLALGVYVRRGDPPHNPDDRGAVLFEMTCCLLAFFLFHLHIARQLRASRKPLQYFRRLSLWLVVFVPGLLMLTARTQNAVLSIKPTQLAWILRYPIMSTLIEFNFLWVLFWLSALWIVITWILANLMRLTAFILDRALAQGRGFLAGIASLLVLAGTLMRVFE